MKTKKEILKKFLLILAVGIGFCLLVYLFFDKVLNGRFVDFFTNTYTYTHEITSYDGEPMLIQEIYWPYLKILLLFLFCLFTLFLIGAVLFSWHMAAKKTRAQTQTHAISQARILMQSCMKEENPDISLFPPQYSELAVEMLQIKSTMTRHEQMLHDENSRKNDLITYLAHDLKTPLTSVIGYLSLLDEAPDMPEVQRRKYVHLTFDKACRLEKLINEFFDITRYNFQQILLEKETIDLSFMLVQMTDEFYPLLHSHGNFIHLDIPENVQIYGDSMKLARVFNNILKNAISYSYPDTEITIRVTQNKLETVLEFSNHGITIPKEKLNHLFEKFFRLDETRSTGTGGAGLGLAIAREIVTLHGGVISAESVQEVTTFTVALPAP